MKKKILTGSIAVALAVVSIVGVALAYRMWREGTTENRVSMGVLSAVIQNEYEEPLKPMPGDVIPDVVNVQNIGKTDAIVRVKVTKAWMDGDEEAEGLSADNVDIRYHTDASSMWMDGGDGYYYYKDILAAGQQTKQPLFEEFKIAESTGDQYEGKRVHITIDMEAVQAAANAVSGLWDKEYEDLGIHEPAARDSESVDVLFVKSDEQYGFQFSEIDLFTNYKELLPGETREETVSISNKDEEARNFYFRAKVPDNSEEDPLIQDMMQKYLTIRISELQADGSEGKLLYEGPVWQEDDTGKSAVDTFFGTRGISLGTIGKNSSKMLKVQLTADEEMDNEYQGLASSVQWIFTTEWEKNDNGSNPPGQKTSLTKVKTGDAAWIAECMLLLLASGMAVLYFERKRKKNH